MSLVALSPRLRAGQGLRRWLSLLAVVCGLVSLSAAQSAHAQVVVDRPLQIVGNGNSAQIRLCNESKTQSILVGLATYLIPPGVGPGPGQIPSTEQLNRQVLFDFKEQVLGPGQCVVLTVRIPSRKQSEVFQMDAYQADAFQVDAFGRGVIVNFAGSDYYAGRLLAGQIFGH
jgi:hypothetical protein